MTKRPLIMQIHVHFTLVNFGQGSAFPEVEKVRTEKMPPKWGHKMGKTGEIFFLNFFLCSLIVA